uniref:Packaging protein n=1 Tax=Gokushovirinae environmental samples TaxID=1478972 RepID=A0A2R3UAD9_9VIRU|nr:packaging protein [Gokushovirinae environmental samples]
MEYQLITILDRAIQAFLPLGNVRAEGEALRVFKDMIEQQGSPQNKHPDDYDLYIVGKFNDQTGEITPEKPRKIADGKTYREMLSAT